MAWKVSPLLCCLIYLLLNTFRLFSCIAPLNKVITEETLWWWVLAIPAECTCCFSGMLVRKENETPPCVSQGSPLIQALSSLLCSFGSLTPTRQLTVNWGTVTVSETSTSIPSENCFILEEKKAVKTKGTQASWWWESSRESTKRRSAQLSRKHCYFTWSRLEHEPALFWAWCYRPSHSRANWSAEERCLSAPLYRLLITGESWGCSAPVDAVNTAGLSLAATCLHGSSGKGSRFPGFFPQVLLSGHLRQAKFSNLKSFM